MKTSELGAHKLDPKLRMVANGSEVVNTLRAEQAAYLTVQDVTLLEDIPIQTLPGEEPIERSALPADARGKLEKVPDSVFANVFIQLEGETPSLPDSLSSPRVSIRSVSRGNLVSASVPLDLLQEIYSDPAVIAIEVAESLAFFPPVEVSNALGEAGEGISLVPELTPPGEKERALIGIIDVQGFDFAHPDFLDEQGNSRFIRIWDQGGHNRPPPKGYDYGSELTQEMLNTAIEKSPQFGLPPTQLEPQSQMVPSSHGTHVASIAAGNHGVCPNASIAAVLISLPQEDLDRRKSFYDSSCIVHAVEYLFKLGEDLKLPVSVNISLGTNGHAHDGSSMTSRWIDYELVTAGRSVCVAAGNAGQEAAEQPGDWGYIVGRIHSSGQITQENPVHDIYWVVVGNGVADISENELEIWYSPRDHYAVQILPPQSTQWTALLEPGEYIENQEMEGTFVSIYNEVYAPANGYNYISCHLSPFFARQGIVGIRSGTWTVRLQAKVVRDGTFHAWIERDDPRRLGRTGAQEIWSFPSFFSERSNIDHSSVNSLACGNYIISVANLDTPKQRIHKTSSQGPTRDGRKKPEVAAPGTDIIAARGFEYDPGQRWVSMTGTSMASPYVAGVIGRMLAIDPSLTAAQIAGIIQKTATPLPGADFQWKDDAGYGRIDPGACLEEVKRLRQREDRTP